MRTDDHGVDLMARNGQLQHCMFCGQPVLGLAGQDQMITEIMAIQAQANGHAINPGWLHTLCAIDAGFGMSLFELRVRSLSGNNCLPNAKYYVSINRWLEEVRLCCSTGQFWMITHCDLNRAVLNPDGLLVPVSQDLDFIVIWGDSSADHLLPAYHPGQFVHLTDLIAQLGIGSRLVDPAPVASGRYFPLPLGSPSAISGKVQYETLIPGDAIPAMMSMGVPIPGKVS